MKQTTNHTLCNKSPTWNTLGTCTFLLVMIVQLCKIKFYGSELNNLHFWSLDDCGLTSYKLNIWSSLKNDIWWKIYLNLRNICGTCVHMQSFQSHFKMWKWVSLLSLINVSCHALMSNTYYFSQSRVPEKAILNPPAARNGYT